MINIAELLKDAPKDMKLYSPLFGEVKFKYINGSKFGIVVEDSEECSRSFDKYGRYFTIYDNAECLLFPSKECRTWKNFKLTKPKFKVGDWIACNADSFILSIKSVRDENYYFHQGGSLPIKDIDEHYHLWSIADAKDGDVLAINWHEDNDSWEKIIIFKNYHAKGVKGLTKGPCVEGYGNTFKNGKLAINEEVPYYSKTWTHNLQPATKEQRVLLFQKMKENGCEWDADKKELKKIQPHYDIKNFHVGTPVLVREYDTCHWQWVQYSHFNGIGLFFAAGKTWRQCIPFNDDTKHLLGTTDMCDEMYINW